MALTREHQRIEQSTGTPDTWRHWGPYLAERAWGTVREDYSADGSAWAYFPHEHAPLRAYRWNEDGLGGISDIRQHLCFAVALWNERDPILKERLFGLTGAQGNHGEDVKEYYFYLDATPSHSYLKYLYKYPQRSFPYADLVRENGQRGVRDWEYELLDTGIFAENRYFDVFVEYAKKTVENIAIRITVHNRGPETAPIHILPTLWFRNTWSWGNKPERPTMLLRESGYVEAQHHRLGKRYLFCEDSPERELLFTENETNFERLFRVDNRTPYVKDAFHRYIIQDEEDSVNRRNEGTKMASWYRREVPSGESVTIKLWLRQDIPAEGTDLFGAEVFDRLFAERIAEADEFYATLAPAGASEDARRIQRQAFAGLIWTKQFYHYSVCDWLTGDPALPPPPKSRLHGRNNEWDHFSCADILSMPDKWEYPWFAAWDTAFHMLPFAMFDADFAKHQLLMLCREWYMHPNGQLPAYEWAFGDVNPPVHAWAALRVYQMERRYSDRPQNEPGDVFFLERIFHKLLLNFTWWVNRKDRQGNNIFEGGFLGLDNIGVFDRSAPLPTGGYIEQSDGTAWMAMYCLNMLAMALELNRVDNSYEDVATKFAEHFVYIAHALTDIGENSVEMWDPEDGFFYDILHLPNGESHKIKVRSIVGLIPLFAVEAFTTRTLAMAPDFRRRLEWFLTHRPNLAANVAHMTEQVQGQRALFSILTKERLRRVLRRVLDPNEFLSPYGIRSLSRYHAENPLIINVRGHEYRVDYTPAESDSRMFGGNSNWRGPIWFPFNYLLIEALRRYDSVYGESFTVEFPTGSGRYSTLGQVADDLSHRLTRLFLRDHESGKRPVYGGVSEFQNDPHWRDHILFYEYFHGDNGAGLGASHQTGWTALVANLISEAAK
ncbi:MAG: glucosidase [Armatimonadaceae bacterium]